MSVNSRSKFENAGEVRDFIAPLLKEGIITVTFEKVNGDVRKMECTLMEEYLPPQKPVEEAAPVKKHNPDVYSVWSVNDKGWRSFRLNHVTNILFGV